MEVSFEFEWWPNHVNDFEDKINKVFAYHLDFILDFKNRYAHNVLSSEEFEDGDRDGWCTLDCWSSYVKFNQCDIYYATDKVIDEFEETDTWQEANEDNPASFSEQEAFPFMEEYIGEMWYNMLQLTDEQIKDKYKLTKEEEEAKENRESSINESKQNLDIIFELVEKQGYSLRKVCQEFLVQNISKESFAEENREVSIDESEQNLDEIKNYINKYGDSYSIFKTNFSYHTILREICEAFLIKRI